MENKRSKRKLEEAKKDPKKIQLKRQDTTSCEAENNRQLETYVLVRALARALTRSLKAKQTLVRSATVHRYTCQVIVLLLTVIIPMFEYCVYEPAFVDTMMDNVRRTLNSLSATDVSNATVALFVHDMHEISRGSGEKARLIRVKYHPLNLTYMLENAENDCNLHTIKSSQGEVQHRR